MTKTEGDNAVAILLHEVYIAELRVHAVTLIWLGYRRLRPTAFATAEEDDITGELVRASDSSFKIRLLRTGSIITKSGSKCP